MQAASLISAPSQNLVYADTQGNIGYQLPGAVPRRGKGDGRLPSPGWDKAYDWRGTIPFAELPWAYNPPGGVLVAANQPVIGGQYPYLLGSSYSYGWRSQQLADRLRETSDLTLDEAEQLFYDDTIRVAADLVPTLLKIKVADPWVVEGQRVLVGWDYRASPDSAAAAYFNVVMHDILKLTFRDELPAELWPAGGDRWNAVVADLLAQPRNLWWDDMSTPGVTETRDDILLAAMTDARKEITSLAGPGHRRVAVGPAAHGHAAQPDAGQERDQAGRGAVQPRPVSGWRGTGGGERHGLRRQGGVLGDQRPDHADAGRPRQSGPVPMGQPERGVWSRLPPQLRRPDRALGAQQTWPFVSSRAAVEARTEHRLELVPTG